MKILRHEIVLRSITYVLLFGFFQVMNAATTKDVVGSTGKTMTVVTTTTRIDEMKKIAEAARPLVKNVGDALSNLRTTSGYNVDNVIDPDPKSPTFGKTINATRVKGKMDETHDHFAILLKPIDDSVKSIQWRNNINDYKTEIGKCEAILKKPGQTPKVIEGNKMKIADFQKRITKLEADLVTLEKDMPEAQKTLVFAIKNRADLEKKHKKELSSRSSFDGLYQKMRSNIETTLVAWLSVNRVLNPDPKKPVKTLADEPQLNSIYVKKMQDTYNVLAKTISDAQKVIKSFGIANVTTSMQAVFNAFDALKKEMDIFNKEYASGSIKSF